MTRSRSSINRELFGIIGKYPNASKIQAEWNAFFKKERINAYMDKYKTSVDQIPERLSEMFHFDRRMYIVGNDLQNEIGKYLDNADKIDFPVNIILNKKGVLEGKYLKERLIISSDFIVSTIN